MAHYPENRRTRIKVCGITRLADAQCAAELGVDAVGFVFVAASGRHVEPATARKIAARLPPFMVPVGLFLNAEARFVQEVLDAIPSLVPQFHGNEHAEWCEAFKRPYLKAVGVADGLPAYDQLAAFKGAQAFLLDSHAPGELGGTGHTFDWSVLGVGLPRPLVLAGGLSPANVAGAVHQVRPYAVDVSSGVEQARGVKDHEAMREFVSAVRGADTAAAQHRQALQGEAAGSQE